MIYVLQVFVLKQNVRYNQNYICSTDNCSHFIFELAYSHQKNWSKMPKKSYIWTFYLQIHSSWSRNNEKNLYSPNCRTYLQRVTRETCTELVMICKKYFTAPSESILGEKLNEKKLVYFVGYVHQVKISCSFFSLSKKRVL